MASTPTPPPPPPPAYLEYLINGSPTLKLKLLLKKANTPPPKVCPHLTDYVGLITPLFTITTHWPLEEMLCFKSAEEVEWLFRQINSAKEIFASRVRRIETVRIRSEIDLELALYLRENHTYSGDCMIVPPVGVELPDDVVRNWIDRGLAGGLSMSVDEDVGDLEQGTDIFTPARELVKKRKAVKEAEAREKDKIARQWIQYPKDHRIPKEDWDLPDPEEEVEDDDVDAYYS